MKPNFITIPIFLFISFTVFAQTEKNCIWIKHANNSYSCIMLDANPQLTFEGESIVIDSKSYKIDEIVSYRFGNSLESAVNDIACDDFHIVFKDDEIEVHNLKWNTADAVFSIFDGKGNAIRRYTYRNTNQPEILNIADLIPGLYFLRVGGSTFKFIKK